MTAKKLDTSEDSQIVGTYDAARPKRGEDTAAFREKALAWLRNVLPAQTVEITNVTIPQNNGFSAETIFLELRVDGETNNYVMRRDPVESALFVGLDSSHQAAVMAALNKAGRVPVPAIIGEERDPSVLGAPFFVMEHIEGRIPPDNPPYTFSGWVHDLSAPDRETLWWAGIDAMAGTAMLDWHDAGLGHIFRGSPTQSGVAWELDYYLRLHRDYADGVQGPFIAEAARWIETNMPAERELALSWGDARLGNMIFRGLECAAVIDWELSTLGARERDLGWWLYIDSYYHEGLGAARAAGWPSQSETVEHYQHLTGKAAPDVGFYKAFAAFRSSVISARFTALGFAPDVPAEDYPPARVFQAAIKRL